MSDNLAVSPDTPVAAPLSSASAAGAPLPVKHRKICVALCVALGFILGCAEFVVLGIEPQISAAFGVPIARVGDLVSSFAIAYAVLTPVLALVTGRFRRYSLLATYVAVFNLANLLAVLAPSFEMLVVARIAIGAVAGGLLAVGTTFIPELLGVRRASFGISVVYAAFSVAMVFSTSLGKMIAEWFNWHMALVMVFAVGAAVSVALLVFMPRSGSTDAPATVRDQLPLLLDPRILAGMAIFVFGIGSVYVFYGYITPYLEDVLGMSPEGASVVLMVYGGICLVSNLLSGWIDARFGMRSLLVTFPIQALALLGLFLSGSSIGRALCFVCVVALTMCLVSVPCITLFMGVARREHPKALTLATSIEPFSYNIGIAFGTAVGGAVIAGPGMQNVGLVGMVFALLAWGLSGLAIHLARSRRMTR